MAITIMGSFLVTKVDGAKPHVREGRSMRQPKRPRESTTRPSSRWLAEIRSRLSGPGGLYNLGNALGFGSGLFVAFLGTSEFGGQLLERSVDRNAICRGKSGRHCAHDRNSDLLLERGGLPSGLVERVSARSKIDAARRSFVGLWGDRPWRGPIPARQSRSRRNFGAAACRRKVRQRFRCSAANCRLPGSRWTPARSAATSY